MTQPRRTGILILIVGAVLGLLSTRGPVVAPAAPTSVEVSAQSRPPGPATASPASPAPAAPVAPVREAPLAPAVASTPVSSEVAELRADLERLVRGITTRGSRHGVLVVSLDRGDTLFSHNADLPLAPASNMKLFSTAAALYYLGPNFRYSTFALADGPIRDGVLQGDLILYGTGDPAISSRMLQGALPPLRALADSLLVLGVREIRGDVVGDGSYFDDAWIGEGWREEYRLASYSAPVGALSLAENIISVRVAPGAAVGQAADIRTTPGTTGLLVHNRVRTVASGSTSVRFSYDPTGLVVEGQIARGAGPIARTVTVVDPANFAAAAFRNVLEQAGIRVQGGVRTIRQAEESPVVSRLSSLGSAGLHPPRVVGTHLSPTLAEVATVTNHVSQNLFAEALFKTVGRVALGDGSFGGGSRAVQYFLECEKPVEFDSVHFVDGSGLSPDNRVTARVTIHLLDLMTRTDVWEPFFLSLPEAAAPTGGQHSLRGRMGGTPAARNLRAKTGTISNVSGLSGYVTGANGERIAFSIYSNDVPSTALAKRTEDAIGIRLARFTRPSASPTGPADASPATDDPEVPPAIDAPAAPPTEERIEPSPPPSPPASTPAAGPRPEAAARTHRVSRGETLDGIARRYGTNVAALQRANPGLEPRRLQIGQTIRLPAE
jgi:serine-type D-Ala-D-Ala carboxypeptidase/endopeptidase (penicillin-binding protein 4)